VKKLQYYNNNNVDENNINYNSNRNYLSSSCENKTNAIKNYGININSCEINEKVVTNQQIINEDADNNKLKQNVKNINGKFIIL